MGAWASQLNPFTSTLLKDFYFDKHLPCALARHGNTCLPSSPQEFFNEEHSAATELTGRIRENRKEEEAASP